MKKILILGSLCLLLVGCTGAEDQTQVADSVDTVAENTIEQVVDTEQVNKERKVDLAELRRAFQKLRGTIADLTIDQQVGDFYRGVVVLGNGGAGNVYVYIAKKTDNGFTILHEEDGVLFCSSIDDKQIPLELLTDCLK